MVYENERIIVVDKPHFLATTPRGMWYRETALMRLRERYREPNIIPAHRLDRPTAGIVVFVRTPLPVAPIRCCFRSIAPGSAMNVWHRFVRLPRPAPAPSMHGSPPRIWPLVRRSRIRKTRGVLCAQEIPGQVNAETAIELEALHARMSARMGMSIGVYRLLPRTGKTHQLRVHMNSLGLPIVGDDFYPRIEERAYDDFSQPLQLVARSLAFTDPFTGDPLEFSSKIELGI